MILVCGILADEMIELMCARLGDMGEPYRLLDMTRLPGEFDITWEVAGDRIEGRLFIDGEPIELSDLSGVYARYVDYRGVSLRAGLENTHEQGLADAEYHLALMELFNVVPCQVVNRPQASTSNDSKPYQQLIIHSHGLLTPRTLVTTVPEKALAFYESCGRRVIYKSVSGVRSIVKRLTEDELSRLPLLANCPTQFQELIDGVDIRVHTVGPELFATEIASDASDYRYARRDGASLTVRAVDIPADVGSACLAVAEHCGLAVAGIDLRCTPDGRYYCFEVNPSPAFLFYERAGRQPISAAVARLLAA